MGIESMLRVRLFFPHNQPLRSLHVRQRASMLARAAVTVNMAFGCPERRNRSVSARS